MLRLYGLLKRGGVGVRPGRVALLILLLTLSACQTESEEPDDAPVATSVAELPTTTPTATPLPPTATHPPTAVPPTTTATLPPPTETPLPPAPLSVLNYYGGQPSGVWDSDMVDRFVELNPNVLADRTGFSLYSNPVPESIHGRLARDVPADVVTGYIVGNMREYVAQGEVTDISDLWQEQGWDEAFPTSLRDMVTVDGKQYFAPQAMQWNPIWYRADIFADLGIEIPTTWEEFLGVCDSLNAAGVTPIAVSSISWTPPMARWFTILNLRLNGPEFHERLMQGQERYDDPRVRDVFEHWAELFARGCFDDDRVGYGTAANQLFTGQAAMYNLGEWLSESHLNGLPDTYDFFSFPVLNPDVPRAEIVLVYGGFIPGRAANPDTARDYLAFLGSVDSQATRVEDLNQLVANQNVDQSQLGDVYLKGYEFVSEADHLTQLYEFNTHPEMAEVGLSVFSSFFVNQDDIDGFMATLEVTRLEVYGELP